MLNISNLDGDTPYPYSPEMLSEYRQPGSQPQTGETHKCRRLGASQPNGPVPTPPSDCDFKATWMYYFAKIKKTLSKKE